MPRIRSCAPSASSAGARSGRDLFHLRRDFASREVRVGDRARQVVDRGRHDDARAAGSARRRPARAEAHPEVGGAHEREDADDADVGERRGHRSRARARRRAVGACATRIDSNTTICRQPKRTRTPSRAVGGGIAASRRGPAGRSWPGRLPPGKIAGDRAPGRVDCSSSKVLSCFVLPAERAVKSRSLDG